MATNNNRSMTLADDEDECQLALDASLSLASANAERTKKRMLEKGSECHDDAKRLRAEAMRLEQEADQKDMERSDFLARSDAADSLFKSLQYETLLVRLTRNDKDTTVVDGRNFPIGHGRALGAALRRNTMVTKLDLQFFEFFSTTDSEHRAKQEMEPLLVFLKNNTSLVSLGVSHDNGGARYANSVFYTMSDILFESILKLKHIERLSWDRPVTAAMFRRIMKTWNGLGELAVRLEDDPDNPSTRNNERAVLSGFLSNPMLRKLKLLVVDDRDLNSQILPRLSDVSTLEELCLKTIYVDDEALVDALSTNLQATCTLQRLELDGFIAFIVNDSEMTRLVAALQGTPNSLPTVFISALSFRTCEIDHNAYKHLASFLQIQTTDEAVSKSTFNSSLRELHVSAQDEEDVVTGRMGSFLSRKLAASILKMPPKREPESDANGLLSGNIPPLLIPTIGSQITTLSLMWVHSCFFDHLQENADRVGCLQRLELVGMTKPAAIAFSKCIPKLRSLRTLKILPLLGPDSSSSILRWILCGLKRNQSLHKITTSDDDTRSDFNESHLCLIDAYCQRNQALTRLLGSKPRATDESRNGTHSKSTNDDTAALCIHPELLGVAYHIANARSTMFTKGLLSLGRSVADDKSN